MVPDSSSRYPRTRVLLSSALTVALVMRVAAILVFGDVSAKAELWEYGEQGRCAAQHGGELCMNYLSGAGYYPSAYMPPLLSYAWFGLFELFGDGPVARAAWLGINVLVALGCVALTYHLSLQFVPSKWVAFVAASLMAVYPTFVFSSATYHQTNWAVFLLLAVSAIAVKLAGGANPWLYGATGGLLCGLAALNRSEMLIIGPILLALGACWRRQWSRIVTIGVVGALSMAIVVVPWAIRNYEVFDRVIPTAQSEGYNLWKGYTPYTNGSGNLSEKPDSPGYATRTKIRAGVAEGPDYEPRLQDAFLKQFRADVHDSSTGRLVKLAFNKVALLWAFDWTDHDVTGRMSYRFPWVATNLFAVLGLVFLWRWRRRVAPAPGVIYGAALLLLTAAYAVTSVHARYRMHIEPFLFVLAGVGVVGLWGTVLSRRKSSVRMPPPHVSGDDGKDAMPIVDAVPIVRAFWARTWRLFRGLSAFIGVIALFLGCSPSAVADPSPTAAVAVDPTISLADLGANTTLAFYRGTSSTTLTVPAPAGLVPATLNLTLNLPFDIRSGMMTVKQDDRIISKLGLPLTDMAPLVIPLPEVQIIDDAVRLTLTMTVLPQDGFCLDPLTPVTLINGSVTYSGAEIPPTTIADFLPPVLRKLTIAVPDKPSQAESDSAVQLAASLVSRYRSQSPQVNVVSLPDGVSTIDVPALPMERQIVIKEGQDAGLSLVATTGIPNLLISGPPDKLRNQARLLTDGSVRMAVSAKVVAGELRPAPAGLGNITTLTELGQAALSTIGFAPQVSIGLDQTRFGHATQGFRVHVIGSYTPVPNSVGAQLVAAVGDETIDTWPADAAGVIDRWVTVPDRLVQRYTDLTIGVNTSGGTGVCDAFRPITLTIDGGSVVESTTAVPPIPSGFASMPQALMPAMQVGIGADSFPDTVRATQIVTGLQRLSVLPLSTNVTSVKQALESDDPAILISPDGWTDTSIALPVSADDRQLTLAGPRPGSEPTMLTLDPGIRFGSIQAVFQQRRTLLIATSNGAPDQLDALLQWFNDDARRWTQLSGNAVVAIAGRPPATILGGTPPSVYGPQVSPQVNQRGTRGWWIGGGVLVALLAAGATLWIRARRQRTGEDAADILHQDDD
jgi:hypothetical protein